MNYQAKLDEAKAKFAEARALLLDPNSTVEDKGRVEGLMEEGRALKLQAAQLQEISDSFDDILAKHGAERSEEVDGEPEQRGKKKFADWSDFLYSAWRANHKDGSFRKTDPRLVYFKEEPKDGMSELETKVMTEGTGASGGFLVPLEQMAELQGVIANNSIVRSRGATVIRMRRRQISLPVLDQTGTTAGVPHWFGGLLFYWAEEATEKTVSDASFREVVLTAHKLIGYTTASDELVDDAAISLGDFLSGPLGFAGGVSWMEDYAFINGSGVGQPLGVINAGATITVNRAAKNLIGYGDLCDMVEAFLPSGTGSWTLTQSALSSLLQLQGPAGNPSYIWGSAISGGPATLLGYPVTFSEKNPRIGTAGDAILADWKYYLIGDRQATTVESTQYDLWRYDKTSWRVVHRVDGQPWLSAPLTYQDGTTQVSPFVILGAKST